MTLPARNSISRPAWATSFSSRDESPPNNPTLPSSFSSPFTAAPSPDASSSRVGDRGNRAVSTQARLVMAEATFFATPSEFRAWCEQHHDRESELLVGFHKKGSGLPSITWPEAVDQALCFGWIDGIRRSIRSRGEHVP